MHLTIDSISTKRKLMPINLVELDDLELGYNNTSLIKCSNKYYMLPYI